MQKDMQQSFVKPKSSGGIPSGVDKSSALPLAGVMFSKVKKRFIISGGRCCFSISMPHPMSCAGKATAWHAPSHTSNMCSMM